MESKITNDSFELYVDENNNFIFKDMEEDEIVNKEFSFNDIDSLDFGECLHLFHDDGYDKHFELKLINLKNKSVLIILIINIDYRLVTNYYLFELINDKWLISNQSNKHYK